MTQAPERYMGGGLARKEDPNLVTGKANWTDNIKLPGMLHVALLRSPLAHAKVTNLDVSAALEQPGVVAAYTGADLADEWPGGVPCAATVTEDQKTPFQGPIVQDEVKYMGDVVAAVVATDRYTAQDALEAIEVDYELLDVVMEMEAGLEDGATRSSTKTWKTTCASTGRPKPGTWTAPSSRRTSLSKNATSSSGLSPTPSSRGRPLRRRTRATAGTWCTRRPRFRIWRR